MGKTKIVLIGAGSVIFSLRTLQDLIAYKDQLGGSTVVLVDINEEVLDSITKVAQRMNEESGAGYVIESTTDRRQALPGAEFVIISVEINRDELWKLDWQIPLKHGIKHILGENAGPGGLSHTLRTVPLVLEICKDIEAICPNALVLNFTNPESRVCMAISRYTNLRAVGLCHQISAGTYDMAHILGWVDRIGPWPDLHVKWKQASELLDVKAAGINHFTWVLDVRDKRTGEDLYPRFREAERDFDPNFEPLSRALFHTFGLFPATGDEHAGELIGYAWEFVGLEGFDFEWQHRLRIETDRLMKGIISGVEPLGNLITERSSERVVDIIAAIKGNRNTFELSANIVNNGCIPNLPPDAIVEVPVIVSGDGIRGLNMGPLPTGIAAMCAQQVAIQKLAVEAAVTGDRTVALQALLLDPVVGSYEKAQAVLDDLLTTHAAYLPQFT